VSGASQAATRPEPVTEKDLGPPVWRERFHTLLTYTVLVGVAAVMLFPGFWMIVTALTETGKEMTYPPTFFPSPIAWNNFGDALAAAPFPIYLRNSLLIAILATVGALITESMAGFAFARLRFPGRDFWFAITLALLMLPFVVTVVPRFVIFKELGMTGTLLPLIVPYWFGGTAFGVFLFRQYFRTVPMELDEAARIDGAGHLRVWWSIVLPQSGAVFVTLAILHFVWFWNDFMGPLIYLNRDEIKTLPLGVMKFYGQYTQDWNYMMASALMMTVPIILIVLVGQRYFQRGIATTGLGGR
jgi:ABC-type glycerol-3-phosphate transport system permease component